MKQIILGDNLEVLRGLPDKFAQLIIVDPPYGIGHSQKRTRIKSTAVESGKGDRIGFGGKDYISEKLDSSNIYYEDKSDNFEEFLIPRIEASLHCLTDDGSFFVFLDDRQDAYVRVAIDKMFGNRDHFIQTLVWNWDFGARSKTQWSRKHNSIHWFCMNRKNYVFNYDAMDRIPYMSGKGLVSEEKLKIGKTPTSCWFHTIIGTNSKERQDTGMYPSAKPIGIIDRLVKVHSNPNDIVLDYFAGSGTTGASAEKNGRGYCLIDSNPDAVKIMKARLPTAQCIGF